MTKSRRQNHPVAVRFRAQDLVLADRIARRHGLTRSAVLRMATQQGIEAVADMLQPVGRTNTNTNTKGM